jgi:hypothetical protein
LVDGSDNGVVIQNLRPAVSAQCAVKREPS